MQFSVWPSFQRPWTEILALARHAERQGWHGIWCADHYMPGTADGTPDDGRALECWGMIAALASGVDRLQLGSLVSPSTVHHPAVLAKQASTIDEISGGRVVLGLGAGWQVNEHQAYGIDLPPPGRRVDRFAELIEIVHGLLHQPRTTFQGASFSVVDAPCEPKGGPVPILVGSGSRRMLGLTARFADAWNTWGTPEGVRDRSGALDAACATEGRDPATIRRTAQALVLLRDDAAAAEAGLAQAPAERTIAGTATQLIDRMGEYRDAGLDEFIVPDFTLGRTATEREETYDRLWSEVFSPFV